MRPSYGETSGFSVVNTEELLLVNGGKGSSSRSSSGGGSSRGGGLSVSKNKNDKTGITASVGLSSASVQIRDGNEKTSVSVTSSINYSLKFPNVSASRPTGASLIVGVSW